MRHEQTQSIARELQTQAFILGGSVILMWVVEIADIFWFRGHLDRFGIIPRNPIGLRGILFMPFLHGGFYHLIANTPPFLVLGWLVMLREISDFFVVTLVTMVVGGLGVWLFGAPGFHIGASSLIFGYLGFLLLRGWFDRRPAAIVLSIVVGFLYGGFIWGVLPSRPGISWEGHLFGFLAGVLAARLLSRKGGKG
jgi:membrane associated rhomboid family serine protease